MDRDGVRVIRYKGIDINFTNITDDLYVLLSDR